MRERRLLSLGFGGAVMAALAVPVLNFLVIPCAVAGATAMWVEQLDGDKTGRRTRLPPPGADKAFAIELRAADFLGIHAPLFGRRALFARRDPGRMDSAPTTVGT